jgi:hypothetical protein
MIDAFEESDEYLDHNLWLSETVEAHLDASPVRRS